MDDTYRITGATTWRELDGEIVALDTKASVYFSIGGFGSRLWPPAPDTEAGENRD